MWGGGKRVGEEEVRVELPPPNNLNTSGSVSKDWPRGLLKKKSLGSLPLIQRQFYCEPAN